MHRQWRACCPSSAIRPRLTRCRAVSARSRRIEASRWSPSEDDVAIGLACVTAHATIHAVAPVGYITALVTTSAARGTGVGRALVTAAETWAREQGCVRLSVTSAEHRADAHAFYPRCGMPYSGRRFSKTIAD
jgi:GNAT superfamily N-acetyltransferase